MNEPRHAASLRGRAAARLWETCALAGALAASMGACDETDDAPDEGNAVAVYEYGTVEGFTSISLEAAAEASGTPPGVRRVAISVARPWECLPGCSDQVASTCDVIVQEDDSIRIEVVTRFRTLIDPAGDEPRTCAGNCVWPGGSCGEIDWPDGEELRIEDEVGTSWVAPADTSLPVRLGVQW
jgi:hypothetical protein